MERPKQKKQKIKILLTLLLIISLTQSTTMLWKGYTLRNDLQQTYNNLQDQELSTGQLYQYMLEQRCYAQTAQISLQNQTTNTTIPQSELYLILAITDRFAEIHKYNRTTYNCINYSKDLKHILQSLGYNITIQAGYPANSTTGHAWNTITLNLEPQQANIFTPQLKYPKPATKQQMEELK